MKYSVLLPTRNGGKFLRNCIKSVLTQDHPGFELVISDNANDDETPGIIAEVAGDPRVRSIRLEKPVGVTENWNAAYAESSGDFILMMGDDDYLLPGFFQRMDALLAAHSNPDCILYNGYSFVAPGSIASDPRAFYNPHHFTFGPDLQSEQILSGDHKSSIVRDMYRWKARIPLNMQTTLVARRVAERIEGGFFQPPFPDHYALNALLLMPGVRWLFTPERLVVVGVSPKSFGHYVYSGEQASGLEYLGIDPTFPGELPGNPLLNGTHVWLDRLAQRFPNELRGVRPDRSGYVRRQVYSWIAQKRFGGLSWSGLVRRFRSLSPTDWPRLAGTLFEGQSWGRLVQMMSPRVGAARSQWQGLCPLPGIGGIDEFGEWLSSGQGSKPAASKAASKRARKFASE